VEFFNVFLNSRRLFVLCLVYISYFVLGLVPGDRANSVDWAQLSRFHLKTETESSLRNVVFYIKTGRWIISRNTVIAVSCSRY
jgi:hypothetical protein